MSASARYHAELLALPFFDAAHRALAGEANAWAAAHLAAQPARREPGRRRCPVPLSSSRTWAPPA